MIEIGIVGAKNSGKTTLIEKMLNYLNGKGFRVATIKHTSHNHGFDIRGKDSYRHRQAGSDMTIVISNTETAVYTSSITKKIDSLKSNLLQDYDICLVEGDKEGNRPKILLSRFYENTKLTDFHQVIAVYGTEIPGMKAPAYAVDQISDLSEYIIKRLKESSERIAK
jgi:molybdopterin-guanine dinucleotide biosynthesis protein MobB